MPHLQTGATYYNTPVSYSTWAAKSRRIGEVHQVTMHRLGVLCSLHWCLCFSSTSRFGISLGRHCEHSTRRHCGTSCEDYASELEQEYSQLVGVGTECRHVPSRFSLFVRRGKIRRIWVLELSFVLIAAIVETDCRMKCIHTEHFLRTRSRRW